MNSASRDLELTEQLIAHLSELESLLENEYSAIRQRDLVQLESVTHDKQRFVDEINHTAAEMGAALSDLITDESSANSNIIRASLARCATANKKSGCAIESSQSFTTSLLDVLHGRVPGERTYTARGFLGTGAGSSAFCRA